MPEIKPRIDDDGVPWCDGKCPQAIMGPFPYTKYEDVNCRINGAIVRTAERISELPAEVCPHAVQRMAVENEAWRDDRMHVYTLCDCVVRVKFKSGVSRGFTTLDAAIDALMAEREE